MSRKSDNSEDVLSALKKTSKGRLSYDRNWKEEGRAQEIMNEVKLQLSSITLSPKSCQSDGEDKDLTQKKNKSSVKYKVRENVINSKTVFNDNKISGELRPESRLDSSQTHNSFDNKNESITEIDFINYEKERQEIVRNKVENHLKLFESNFKEYSEEIEEESRLTRQRYLLESIKKMKAFEEEYEALKQVIASKQTDSADKCSNTSFKLKEIESKHQLLVEEHDRKQQQIRKRQMLSLRTEVDSTAKNLIDLTNSVENEIRNSDNFHVIKHELHSIINLIQTIDILLTKTFLTESDINNIEDYKSTAINMSTKIVSEIQNIKQSVKQRSESVCSVSVRHTVSKDNTNVGSQVLDQNKSSPDNVEGIKSNPLSDFVDYEAFKQYLNLQQFSNNFENSIKSFITEPKFKQKKNDLQLFVKTTINTISCESVEHIRDKLKRLTLLFNEKPVEYGGKQISCSKNDNSLNFCISLASKMFISVSTKQKDIALTMAPIIVLLWSRFPIFGQIFMGQMQEKCPYVVPYYPKRETDESQRDYLIACGYSIGKDGSEESEESFLNRMRAMIKLYAAIIQSNVQHNHPQDLHHGWSWISRLLNLKPRTGLTAAVLEAFLSISSHKLYRFYRKQYIKLISFILSDYIQRIEGVTLKGDKRQSLVKLTMYINELKKLMARNASYKDLMPKGVLPDYFFEPTYNHSWGTQSFK